jgi:predicted transposase/invertase (TIGR01784 family)
MKRDDMLWKGLIEDLFPEFLQFFYPQAKGVIDKRTSFEFLDKELQDLFPSSDTNGPPKFVDKLVRARTHAKEEEWILVHIEIQGYREQNFPERMFKYYYRIRDRYDRPVTAIAIFTGSRVNVVDEYKDGCLGTEISYKYNVYDIWQLNEEDLKRDSNPFALIILAARTALLKGRVNDEELITQHTWLFEALEAKKVPQRKKMIIWAFLVNCVQFAAPETYRIFDKQLETITGKNNPMGVIEMLEERGLEKGLQKGREEGRDAAKGEFVANLLSKLDLTDEQIADVAGVDMKFVQRVKDKLKK